MRVEPLFSEPQVRARIDELAERIAGDQGDAALVVLCIAEGAIRFADDLCSALERRGVAHERRVVRASRTQGTALGPVQIEDFSPEQLEGRDVLVTDDIADEGATLRAVLDVVSLGEPRRVRSAVLVDKRERRREALPIEYVGFEVESGWVVGYGMDVDGAYRELDWIGVLRDDRF